MKSLLREFLTLDAHSLNPIEVRAHVVRIQEGMKAKLGEDYQSIIDPDFAEVAKSDDDVMPSHQRRVIDEKSALDDKLAKLTAFFDTDLFAGLDDAEKQQLNRQADVMKVYSDLLAARIATFPQN